MSSLVSSAKILAIVPDSIPPEISPNNFNVQQKRNTHPMESLQPIQRHNNMNIMNNESKQADAEHIVDKDSVRVSQMENQNRNETKTTNAENERYADQHLSQNKTILHPIIDNNIINHAIFTGILFVLLYIYFIICHYFCTYFGLLQKAYHILSHVLFVFRNPCTFIHK